MSRQHPRQHPLAIACVRYLHYSRMNTLDRFSLPSHWMHFMNWGNETRDMKLHNCLIAHSRQSRMPLR